MLILRKAKEALQNLCPSKQLAEPALHTNPEPDQELSDGRAPEDGKTVHEPSPHLNRLLLTKSLRNISSILWNLLAVSSFSNCMRASGEKSFLIDVAFFAA